MKRLRAEEAFRIAVVAAMMAALAMAAGELAARVVPGFDPILLALLAGLLCLEGIASDRLARQFPESGIRLRLHLVEWAVILAALRLVLSLARGVKGLAADLACWLAGPQNLLDTGLVLASILLGVVWWLGIRMSQDLEALGPEALEPPPKDSAAYYAWLTRPREDHAGEGWAHLRQHVLSGGVLVLIFGGLARLDMGQALDLGRPPIAGVVVNALVYFVLGFVLLAQGHYALLRTRWQRQEVPVAGQLGQRWAVLGLAFALGVAVLVLLLPTRPSLALLRAAFDAFWSAIVLGEQAVLIVLTSLAYLLSLLLQSLGLRAAPSSEPPQPPRMPTPQPQPPTQAGGWWEAIQGIVLWVLLALVLGYALVRFVRERRELWALLAEHGGPVGWLARLWLALAGWLAGMGRAASSRWRAWVARANTQSGRPAVPRRLRWPRPASARERVRLLYLLSMHETARAGHPRSRAETPYEYVRRTGPALPEGREALECMTQAFVEARYSPRDFGPAEIGPLKAALQRLRRACRRLIGRDGEGARPERR